MDKGQESVPDTGRELCADSSKQVGIQDFCICKFCYLKACRFGVCEFCEECQELTEEHPTHAHMHSPYHTQVTRRSLARSACSDMPAPSTKAQWIQKLKDEDIAVPSEWTLIQIKAHWAEVVEERRQGLDSQLEEKLKGLKRASRKKSELVTFLQEEGIKVPETATINQLFKLGEEKIYQGFPASGREKVGFGKHGDLTFQEVLNDFPSYVTWCQTTAREEERPYWRLHRLAKWAETQKSQSSGQKGYGGTSVQVFDMATQKPVVLTEGDLAEWEEMEMERTRTTIESKMGKLPGASKNTKGRASDLESENQALRTKIMELEAAQADMELQTGRVKGRKEM